MDRDGRKQTCIFTTAVGFRPSRHSNSFVVRRLLAAMCAACLLLVACAQKNPHGEDAVRAVVVSLAAETAALPDVPGLSAAVLRKGDDAPVTVAFGKACLENDVPMSTASLFKLGSVSKVFTAAVIHDLIERGRLGYDTPAAGFFPGLPINRAITVRMLLEHTSGMAEMLALAPVLQNLSRYWSPEDLISMAAKQPPQFSPGTRQVYCNTGYLMLAVIAEKITGRSYADLVRDMFVRGLGMRSLVVGEDGAVTPRIACGYSGSGDTMRLPLAASISIALGTGDLEATPADVVRLVNLDRVLKNDVFATLPLQPLVLRNGKEALAWARENNYHRSFLDGCTLFLFDKPQITLLGKLGSFPGFGTAYFYDRQTGYAVAVSVNNERAIPHAIALGAKILKALRGQPKTAAG